ncbi:MAG: hypothetical protein H0U75_07770 [Legionella sp.]|nr:hypothetical protein [Legionella sp.]
MVNDILHPIDNILYPISELVFDASIIATAYIINTSPAHTIEEEEEEEEDFYVLQTLIKDSELYQEATLRMRGRVQALETSWTGIIEASNLERVYTRVIDALKNPLLENIVQTNFWAHPHMSRV